MTDQKGDMSDVKLTNIGPNPRESKLYEAGIPFPNHEMLLKVAKMVDGTNKQNIIVCAGAELNKVTLGHAIKPTYAHEWCASLETRGILKRIYTEGPCDLFTKVYVSHDKLVEVNQYENMDSLSANLEFSLFNDFIRYIQYPHKYFQEDECDCIIVLGSTLQTAPFCAIPNMVKQSCLRILVRDNVNLCFSNRWSDNKKHNIVDCTNQIDHNYKPCINTFIKVKKQKISILPKWRKNEGTKYKQQMIFDTKPEHWCFIII